VRTILTIEPDALIEDIGKTKGRWFTPYFRMARGIDQYETAYPVYVVGLSRLSRIGCGT
jgi:hypothetical protein